MYNIEKNCEETFHQLKFLRFIIEEKKRLSKENIEKQDFADSDDIRILSGAAGISVGGGEHFRGWPRRESRGRRPAEGGECSKIFKKFLRKYQKCII